MNFRPGDLIRALSTNANVQLYDQLYVDDPIRIGRFICGIVVATSQSRHYPIAFVIDSMTSRCGWIFQDEVEQL